MAVSEAARRLKAPINPDLKIYPETWEEEQSPKRAKVGGTSRRPPTGRLHRIEAILYNFDQFVTLAKNFGLRSLIGGEIRGQLFFDPSVTRD
jgi:hypothetical protein